MTTTKTDAEKALDEREKLIAQREKDVAARESALPTQNADEDLTPYPTQAMNDAFATGANATTTYKNRAAKSE